MGIETSRLFVANQFPFPCFSVKDVRVAFLDRKEMWLGLIQHLGNMVFLPPGKSAFPHLLSFHHITFANRQVSIGNFHICLDMNPRFKGFLECGKQFYCFVWSTIAALIQIPEETFDQHNAQHHCSRENTREGGGAGQDYIH
uniref:Uncharacterized protein n=1 Tax=Heterosigma akashiwo TaxID=2829 RepID=A0A7S3XJG0_HETAK